MTALFVILDNLFLLPELTISRSSYIYKNKLIASEWYSDSAIPYHGEKFFSKHKHSKRVPMFTLQVTPPIHGTCLLLLPCSAPLIILYSSWFFSSIHETLTLTLPLHKQKLRSFNKYQWPEVWLSGRSLTWYVQNPNPWVWSPAVQQNKNKC